MWVCHVPVPIYVQRHSFVQCRRLRGKADQQRSFSVFSGRIILGSGQGADCYLPGTIPYMSSCGLVSQEGPGSSHLWNNFPDLVQVCHLAIIFHSPQQSQWEFKAGDRISLHLVVHSVLWNTQHTTLCTSSALLLIKHVPEGHTQPDVTKSPKCLEFSWILSGICVNCECELWCFQGQGKKLFFVWKTHFLGYFWTKATGLEHDIFLSELAQKT